MANPNANGRGFTPKRLRAQTVLYNYYLKRPDGKTVAERLFRKKFPDPIVWVIEWVTCLYQDVNN